MPVRCWQGRRTRSTLSSRGSREKDSSRAGAHEVVMGTLGFVAGLASPPCLHRPARAGHQIRHTSARTIGSPGLQPNAAANSGVFEGAPIARNCPAGCG